MSSAPNSQNGAVDWLAKSDAMIQDAWDRESLYDLATIAKKAIRELRAAQSGPSDRDAMFGRILLRYIDRLTDPTPEDSLEKIVAAMDKDVQDALKVAPQSAGADDARDAARYRWLRDSGLAVAAWQDVGAVHWALNGVEYLSLDEGVDEQIKRQSATPERQG